MFEYIFALQVHYVYRFMYSGERDILSGGEICEKPGWGFRRWECITAAAVYLRSAYRIRVNAVKANRAHWVLTQVNSPGRGGQVYAVKFSSPLRELSRFVSFLGDFSLFSRSDSSRLLIQRHTCDGEQRYRETRNHILFLSYFPPKRWHFAISVKYLFIEFCASLIAKEKRKR